MSARSNIASHNGEDPLAAYVESVYRTWVWNIVVGIGNEGNRASHHAGRIAEGETENIEFVSEGELLDYACSLWKPISDEVEIVVQSPNGERTEIISLLTPNRAYLFGQTAVLVNFSEPVIAVSQQQIFILLQGQSGDPINKGLWHIYLRGIRIL